MTANATPELSITLAGVRMRNPIGIGAIGTAAIPGRTRPTPERQADMLLKQVEAGAGCLCVPIRYVSGELLERLEKQVKREAHHIKKGYLAAPSLFMRGTKGAEWGNLYLLGTAFTSSPHSQVGLFERHGSKVLAILRENKPKDVPIIGNVSGLGTYAETYASSAKVAEEAGVEMVEINMACGMTAGPTGSVEDYLNRDWPLSMGACLPADVPEVVESVVSKVTKTVSIPVGVKTSPNTGFPRIVEIARRAKKAGAKFINCSNNATAILPPDIYRRGKPRWPFVDVHPFCAGQGNFMRPIVYMQVAAIAKFAPGIDIIATGGLMTPEHLIEAMMLGARGTHSVTSWLFTGPKFITRGVNFLRRFLAQEGYASVEEIVGLGQQYIKPTEEVEVKIGRAVASLDAAKCSECGLCIELNLCFALSSEDKTVKINAAECAGCGLCVAICPREAISLRQPG